MMGELRLYWTSADGEGLFLWAYSLEDAISVIREYDEIPELSDEMIENLTVCKPRRGILVNRVDVW